MFVSKEKEKQLGASMFDLVSRPLRLLHRLASAFHMLHRVTNVAPCHKCCTMSQMSHMLHHVTYVAPCHVCCTMSQMSHMLHHVTNVAPCHKCCTMSQMSHMLHHVTYVAPCHVRCTMSQMKMDVQPQKSDMQGFCTDLRSSLPYHDINCFAATQGSSHEWDAFTTPSSLRGCCQASRWAKAKNWQAPKTLRSLNTCRTFWTIRPIQCGGATRSTRGRT